MKDKVIKRFEEEKGFIYKNGFKIIELDNEHCKMEYKIKSDGLNPYEIVHGGILFGLADTAAGALASMSGKYPVTMNSTISYLKKARGKRIYAISKILKQGNRIGYYVVDIYDDSDELVCNASVNMYLMNEDANKKRK